MMVDGGYLRSFLGLFVGLYPGHQFRSSTFSLWIGGCRGLSALAYTLAYNIAMK